MVYKVFQLSPLIGYGVVKNNQFLTLSRYTYALQTYPPANLLYANPFYYKMFFFEEPAFFEGRSLQIN